MSEDQNTQGMDMSSSHASAFHVDAINFYSVFGAAMQIATALMQAQGQLASGQPVTIPEVRTYLAGRHIAIDMTIKSI